ncbi:MAG: hypothetical protein J4G09_12800 [Proteobacteria bacterium]|nr:hypothetical protein [Pseudomonadota bacterium]
MSQAALTRIEKAIGTLTQEVAGLRERVDALAGSQGPLTTAEIIEFLDRFRAGEAMGEAGIGAWIATCQTDCLRGGLRTAQMREGAHALLLEQRIKELGGSPSQEMDESAQTQMMDLYGSTKLSDAEKVDKICSSFDPDTILQQLSDQADRMDNDQETQFLLRSIIDDERSTLGFLKQAHDLLCA